MCRLPINSYVNAVGVSVNGKILHPLEHKLATFSIYVNRMLTLPITKQAKKHEWKIIFAIAQNSGFPIHIIHNLKKKLKVKKNRNSEQQQQQQQQQQNKQKTGNILISQSTSTKNNKSLQTH